MPTLASPYSFGLKRTVTSIALGIGLGLGRYPLTR